MATPFPIDLYPLLNEPAKTTSKTLRDIADDGTPHIRVVRDGTWKTIPLNFAPLPEDAALALDTYLQNNPTTEFEITMGQQVFEGYLWADESEIRQEGASWWVSHEFYGRRVS